MKSWRLLLAAVALLSFSRTTRAADSLEPLPGCAGAASATSGAGYLLDGGPTDLKLNASDPLDVRLSQLLDLTGPDMRVMRDFRDVAGVTVDTAKRAWTLMREHALTAVGSRLVHLKPIVEATLVAANVSKQCQRAAQQTLSSAQRLESWAIKLLNAWGSFPPVGLFEGTYGDIGSYHGCVDIPENEAIGHTHYCTIAYRPVLPTRANYELIIDKEPADLLHFRGQLNSSSSSSSSDAFESLLSHAHYNHYVYYKLGTCFPIACSPHDVQQVARLLGRRSILMSGPVKCHSNRPDDYSFKVAANQSAGLGTAASSALQISTRDLNNGLYIWRPHVTEAQWVALVVVLTLLGVIVSFTLIDVVFNRLWPSKSEQQDEIVSGQPDGSPHECGSDDAALSRMAQLKLARMLIQEEEDDNNNNNGQSFEDESANGQLQKVNTDFLFERLEPLTKGPHTTGEELKLHPSKRLESTGSKKVPVKEEIGRRGRLLIIASECSIITNLIQFLDPKESQARNDISCLNGIRSITMCWIIITHTMQYNDWSAFARTREIETHLKSLINQPLFNGSYLVDTFFLVSGLLTSYSAFRVTSGSSAEHPGTSKEASHVTGSSRVSSAAALEAAGSSRGDTATTTTKLRLLSPSSSSFSPTVYLVGRYLRLTPQVVLVSLLFILLPLAKPSGGPHWYTITGEYSENCAQNWWLNLFYIQAFYRSNEMCNFVCWWISVDMFYHLFALVLILVAIRRPRLVAASCACVALAHAIPQTLIHFQLKLPPNLLSTIPQTGAMWSQMTLQLFWTPYAHAAPFFLGFYLGFLMARRSHHLSAWFNRKRARLGWCAATLLILLQSYSTYFWVVGEWRYSPLLATLYFLVSPLVWSSCLAWLIVACQYGHGASIQRALSCKLFIILGKASYVVYLSHFLVLFTFFGSQNLLLEPTQLVMLYVIIGNICLSMLLGSLISVLFEMPWLKAQRWLMRYVRQW